MVTRILTIREARPTPGPMPEAADLLIRPCLEQDLDQVTLIYGHHVLTGTGTFEEVPPTEAVMHERWTAIVTQAWPYLVACPRTDPTRVLGFAYAAQFRPRPGYKLTFEDSVYVAPSAHRMGAGKLLLNEVLNILREDDVREVLALIGDSANAGSIALHASLGFVPRGTWPHVGLKFGRWLDVVVMQKSLRKLA
jgi:L-amino acid N-acyltransferase YncA